MNGIKFDQYDKYTIYNLKVRNCVLIKLSFLGA